MKYDCVCTYCGNQWVGNYYVLKGVKCEKCDDKIISFREIEPIDYYADKPKIKEKIREHNED